MKTQEIKEFHRILDYTLSIRITIDRQLKVSHLVFFRHQILQQLAPLDICNYLHLATPPDSNYNANHMRSCNLYDYKL